MGDRDALDKLEKRLNFDPEENVPKRSSLFARGESAPSEWAVKTAEKTVRKVSGMKPVELLFIGAVIFFIIALVTAGLLFFAGNNTVSTKNVDISITGPSEIGAGSTLSLQVVVTNRNAVPMELTDLVLEFPSGTRSAADISEDLPRVRESLGTIEPGKSVNRTIRAVPFGVQGTAINVKATVEYRVPSSNAVYVVNANYGTRINESPASISIDALTEAVSGQKVTFTVNVRSNAPEVLKDMMLVATYPPGFSFDSSVPEPAGESAWALGDIEPGGTRKVVLTGTFSGEDGETRVAHFAAGNRKPGADDAIAAPLAMSDLSLVVKKPFITAQLTLDGDRSATHAIQRGAAVVGTVTWTNNLPVRVQNLRITLSINGQAVDRKEVRVSRGFYNSNTSSISWDKSTNADLADVGPGQSGMEQFSFSTLAAGTLKDASVNLAVTVTADRLSETSVPEKVESTATAKALVATNLAFHPSMVTAGGPVPPKVGVQSTYSVVWTVTNTGNAMGNSRVSAILPSYVTYLSKTSASEDVTYNDSARTVTWNIGDLSGGDARSAGFQVAFIPSISQAGTPPVIVSGQEFSGLDRFARITVTKTPEPLTTRSASSVNGNVVP